MPRSVPPPHRRSSVVRISSALLVAIGLAITTIQAQIPGRNVNMVSGQEWPGGDPFLQRQNEPTIAASTRNPLHLIGGSNDYRTIDLPGMPGEETGDAWLGLYKSFDGGQRWTSGLVPGYPQDQTADGLASPLKGYQAGADPVVRAGTSGLIFYSGLVFDRQENGKSAIFVTRFLDTNNKEGSDSFAYLGTSLVATSTGADGRFLDKPWMAVDMPRPGAGPGKCSIMVPRPPPAAPLAQRIPAGNIYVAYTSITGNGASLRSEIYVHTSQDCGVTWTRPLLLSRVADRVNQGANLAVDPGDGEVFVTWRRFGLAAGESDAIIVAKLSNTGKFVNRVAAAREFDQEKKAFERGEIFEHRERTITDAVTEEIEEFDQGTSVFSFRSNAYPTATVDESGRLYLAWSERGLAQIRDDVEEGDARILITTTTDALNYTPPQVVDDGAVGHQLMPTIAYAGGRLMLVYYDLRETRSEIFGQYVTDQGLSRRNTMDIRASMGTPGDPPVFLPSVRVSDYLMGYRAGNTALEQLQVNPPNFPMFKGGTVPFIGDYIDVTPAPIFIPAGNEKWAFNGAATTIPPIFHAVWTDNRDVRPPLDGNWTHYTPPTSPAVQPTSLADPTQSPAACMPGNAGSRNQNVYTSRISGGLIVGSPGNSKPLSPTLQRGFVVFAQNTTNQTRSFRMQIPFQPLSTRASFNQFPLPPTTTPPLTQVDVRVPPRSLAARTVYITSSIPDAQVQVNVFEISAPGAPGALPGGLASHTTINTDIYTPDVENPDVENREVYTPDVENPDVENPDVENGSILTPDVENPDVENVLVANPDIDNMTIGNPDVENPDVENDDLANPDVENPDVENGAIADVTWNVTNNGNTTAAFNVNLFLSQSNVPFGLQTQLVIYKRYKTPVTTPNGCELRFETRNMLVTNVPNPTFVTPSDPGLPDPNDPSEKNATLWLGPNETGQITLRIIDNDLSNNVLIENANGELVSIDPAFNPQQNDVTPGVSAQAVDSDDAVAGHTDPPIVTPGGRNLIFLQQPTAAFENTNITPAVTVQARDNSAAVLAGVTVVLTLETNPGDGSINGNFATTGPDGVATFPALQITNDGEGYILRATVITEGPPASALSVPFDIEEEDGGFSPTVVTNTNDSGPGSLRAAMQFANDVSDPQTITFDIGGTGPYVIQPLTPLPPITDPVTIDGTTQPGYDGSPVVGVSGALMATDYDGFLISEGGGGTVIRGLVINNFGTYDFSGGNAIRILSPNTTVVGNYIGTDMTGTAPAETLTYTGIKVHVGPNLIGGANGGDRNVIAGNFQGIWIVGGIGTSIQGNDIGFNRFSAAPIGAHLGVFGNQFGVLVDNGLNTLIGSDSTNFINGNITGVLLAGGTATTINGNSIGVDPNGSSGIPNGDGIGGYGPVVSTVIVNNVISGNGGWGINIDENVDGRWTNASISNNTIGLDTESQPFGNSLGGIRLISGEAAVIGGSLGNVIGSNGGPGIWIGGSTTLAGKPRILGNVIGTTGNGGVVRPNVNEGVVLDGPARVGEPTLGNLISGNGNPGEALGTGILVLPNGANSEIFSNRIGVGNFGAALPNGYSGITVYAVSSVTIGGNSDHDIEIGEAGDFGNEIGGNPHSGIAIYSLGADPLPSDINIFGNRIGRDRFFEGGQANGRYGISVTGLDITIGGDAFAEQNVIVGNGPNATAHAAGIYVQGLSNSVAMLGNIIDGNGGLGIDLDDPGVNANDTGDIDEGTNGRQNWPVLTNAFNGVLPSGRTRVDFNLTSFATGTYTLRFYASASASCDASGNGEGRDVVGVIGNIANGTVGSMELTITVPNGRRITATATDENTQNTSEFSNCVIVTVP